MKYKGDPQVLVSVVGERDENGVWVTTYNYSGPNQNVATLAASLELGPKLRFQSGQNGSANLTATFGDNLGVANVVPRWEVDREFIEKDIMQHHLAASLSIQGKQEMSRWRADPISALDTTADGTVDGGVVMGKLKSLILRGVESIQVSTLVLKRSRTFSAKLESALVLTEQTSFQSTARLIADEAVPSIIALPVGGPTKPDDCEWGWLPRLANRNYIGRGLVEEQNDWVFAAWSTFLYTYLS